MDISMDIHGKSVDMDMDMDGKFHIHGKPVRIISFWKFTTADLVVWPSRFGLWPKWFVAEITIDQLSGL